MSLKTTLKQQINKWIFATIQTLQKFTDRIWYSYLIGILAFLDSFLVFIPTDSIMISSVLLKPKKWVNYAFFTSIGSTIGALLLFYIVESYGLPWLLDVYPGLNRGDIWVWSEVFFKKYGLFLVFFVAVTPLFQQPAVILASLAHTPFLVMLAVIFSGRIIKYLTMAYISSHSPRLFSKLWGPPTEFIEASSVNQNKIRKAG